MNGASRIIVTVLVLAGLGAGGHFAWKHFHKEEAPPAAAMGGPPGGAPMAMPVIAETVTPREMDLTISAVGSLIAGESAEIHAEIAGQIEKISFEEGQPVKKGEVLLQIDRSLIETEYSKAKAAYEVATTTFERDDKLKSAGYVSNQKWDLSNAELKSAKSAVENARIRLQKTDVRAPFDGIAGLRGFSVGDYAETGQTLTTVDAINPLKIEFSVPERNYTDIRTGQKIRFSVDPWPKETFEGEIYAINPRIDPATRNFQVKATIPNDDSRLRPGMYARIAITTAARPEVLAVPEEAIIPQGNDSFVYVIEDGKAAMKKITSGIRQNGLVEVVDGLEAGAEVITAGNMRVHPGMPVMAQPQQPPETAPAAGE